MRKAFNACGNSGCLHPINHRGDYYSIFRPVTRILLRNIQVRPADKTGNITIPISIDTQSLAMVQG